jgi:hypothetical protein
LVIVDRGESDSIHVVGGEEWVAFHMVGRLAEMETKAVEEHDRNVDPLFARGGDTVAQPLKVERIEPGEVKLQLAICRQPWNSARPRLWRHAEVEVGGGRL